MTLFVLKVFWKHCSVAVGDVDDDDVDASGGDGTLGTRTRNNTPEWVKTIIVL